MNQQAFELERRSGIGGSDIHHLWNLSPYGCARSLWYDKRGTKPDYPVEDEGPIRRGRKLESLIVEEYAERTGRTVETGLPIIRHKLHEELMVHVDGRVTEDGTLPASPTPSGDGVLECKTVNEFLFRRWKRDGLPDGYILQLQHAMGVTGAQWGSFAILEPSNWKFAFFDVRRDEETIQLIRDRALVFWPRVTEGPAPERLSPDSPQCSRCKYRTGCQGEALVQLAASAEKTGGEDFAPMISDLGPVMGEYFEARDLRDEAECLYEEVKNRIKERLDTAEVALAPGAKIYYRTSVPERWDTAALQRDGLAAKYKKAGKPQRALRIYAR